jgi:dihydroxycyclohexadiene carboxylate dehydrogenase
MSTRPLDPTQSETDMMRTGPGLSAGQCRRFLGKVAVVTGAAQGIGFATARRLGAEGARVVVADKAGPAADAAVAMLRGMSIEAEAAIADLATFTGAVAVMAVAEQRFGGIDVLVNNVGGAIWKKPFWHFTEDEMRLEVDRSFWPPLWCCRAAIPHFRSRGGGAIVNVGSNATQGIYRIPYSASKGAVAALTAALALELADFNIRVNCVAPGATEIPDRKTERTPRPLTEDERRWNSDFYKYVREESLLGRFATVDEQAAAIAFLASPDASYITGEVLDTGKRGRRISDVVSPHEPTL